ncbi:MAG: CHASE2 domain-containing protein [Desulfococcaceae bacterium]
MAASQPGPDGKSGGTERSEGSGFLRAWNAGIQRIRADRRVLQGALLGLAGALTALALWWPGLLDPWEARSWDWRARVMARPDRADERVRLILLDQKSLDWGKTVNGWPWPWPREVWGVIIDFLRRAGAKSAGLDVLFLEPSAYGVGDDERFGAAVERFGKVAGAAFVSRRSGDATQWPSEIPRPDFQLPEEATTASAYPRAAFPVPEAGRHFDPLCNVHLNPDPDGIYRKAAPLAAFDGSTLPALGIGTYLAAHPAAELRTSGDGLRINGRSLPLDEEGRAILRFRGPGGTFSAHGAAAVIQSELRLRAGETPPVDPAVFRDRYVLIGMSAPGLFDQRAAPTGGVFPGVEIHATLLENLLAGAFIRDVHPAVHPPFVLLFSLLAGVTPLFLARPLSLGGTGVFLLAAPAGCALLAYAGGFRLPLAPAMVGTFFAFALAILVQYATEGRQKRFIKQAFAQYLSPELIETLVREPDRLQLGGEQRPLSIFFSDLERFTAISETMRPEALAELLNRYLTEMTDIILASGGTVDKYEGDAIIAFWNAPTEHRDHPLRAVRAALDCQRRLAELRPGFRKICGRELRMRIGLNSGEAYVGNFGSTQKFDYTMLGDAVNLAARLEGVNKMFGTYTMVSGITRRLVDDDLAFRELGRVQVVGRKEAVTVFEPMFWDDYDTRAEIIADFEEGLDLFYGGHFDSARDLFKEIADRDPVAVRYLERLRSLDADPPEGWTGLWVMDRK